MSTNPIPKSFLRRHAKKIILLSVPLVIFIYVGVCALTVLKVRAVRKQPRRSAALALFTGSLPHSLLGRYFLFRPGSDEFNLDILSWAYDSNLISDNFGNRWILENALIQIREDQRLDLLPLYPLKPTSRLLPHLKKALARGQYRVLPLLNSMEGTEGRQLSRQWIQENIVKPGNSRLFVNASGFLARSSNPNDFTELVNRFWPQLSNGQKELIITKLAGHLARDPQGASEVLAWTASSLENGNLKMTCATNALLGRFLATPASKTQALEVVAKRASDIEANYVDLLFHFASKNESTELARSLADKVKDKNAALLLEIIHHVAHGNILNAEEIAKPFLDAPDSVLKKGVIVVLVRHGSVLGKRMIDDSFTGPSPRKTIYLKSDDYERGNSASERYRLLSTHDYKETGKTWPPSYVRGAPSQGEIAGWKQFIQSYPWYPGTDDAFYRLAFTQFTQGDHEGAWATIKTYLKRDYWPDNDAAPYIYQLLRCLIMVSDISDSEMPFLPHMRNILRKPLVGLVNDLEGLNSVNVSLDWFLANPKYIKYLNTERRTIQQMREIAQVMKEAPPDSVWRLIAARLSKDSATTEYSSNDSTAEETESEQKIESDEKDWDEEAEKIIEVCNQLAPSKSEDPEIYPTGSVQSVLYAVFHDFREPAPAALRVNMPTDTGEEAIRRTASALNYSFSGSSLNLAADSSMEEQITFALLHTGRDFEKWEAAFKPTMDFLSALNTWNIPSVVADRHRELLKERKR